MFILIQILKLKLFHQEIIKNFTIHLQTQRNSLNRINRSLRPIIFIYLFPLVNMLLVIILAGFWVQSGVFASSSAYPTYKWLDQSKVPGLGYAPNLIAGLGALANVSFVFGVFAKNQAC